MSFLIIGAIIYFVFSALSDSDSSSSTNSSSHQFLYPHGEFETGFYNEETNVFAKGPVFSYSLSDDDRFFGYEPGKLLIKNSSGTVEIELRKLYKRILPVCIWVNGDELPVINRHGEFVSYEGNISVARTLNFLLNELADRNADRSIQEYTYSFLYGLIVFNLMTKKGRIQELKDQVITIDENYIYNLGQELARCRRQAEETIDKYSVNYAKDNTITRIESLLLILELPNNTTDLELVKKQYRKLAKKYHPDVYTYSDKKFKEIKEAYDELCDLLKAV